MEKKPSSEDMNDIVEHSLYDRVENGVRCLRIEHDARLWRLGTTSSAWRNALIHVPAVPSVADLEALKTQGLWLREDTKAPKVAITCCGMGSVWPGMGRALYDTFPAARAAMDSIAAVSSWDVLGLLDATEMEQILPSRWQQPYLFLVEYAQASYLASLGFKADVVSGHSIGELVGLCLAEVTTPKDAWEMINIRATMMGEMEGEGEHETGMMVVYASEEVVQNTLKKFPNLLISNYNSPRQFVLSGLRDELMQARRLLRKEKYPALVLNVNMAFHHPQMRSRRQASLESLWSFPMQGAVVPMMSCVTTGLYPQDKAEICEYMTSLDENAVRWVECVQAMWDVHGVRHFVELGPADTVTGFTAEIKPEAQCLAVSRRQNEVEAMRAAVAQLYALGHIPANNMHAVPMAFSVLTEDTEPVVSENAMTNEPIPSYVADILPIFAELTGHDVQKLRPHMDLRHDLGMRSSRFPFIMHALEKQFSIQLRIEDLVQVLTLQDLALVVARLREQGSAAENLLQDSQENFTPQTPESADDKLIKMHRYLPCKQVLSVEPEVWDAFTFDASEGVSSALIIGGGSIAELWENICTQKLGKEKTVQAIDVAQAKKLLEQGIKPSIFVYAPEKSERPCENGESNLLEEHSAFCQMMEEVFVEQSIDFCFVHGLMRKNNRAFSAPSDCLYNSFLATFAGVFKLWQTRYPAVQFQCLGSELSVTKEALEKYVHKIIMACAKKLLPLATYITHEGLHTHALRTQEYGAIHWVNMLSDAEKPKEVFFTEHEGEESLRQRPVLLVSQYAQKDLARIQEGLKEFSECLKGFAPLEARLIWIGDYTPELEVLRSLEAYGLKSTAIVCDMQRREAVRAAIHGIVDQYGHIDGLIYDACSIVLLDFENSKRQRNALRLLVSEAYSHGVRNALALVHTHPVQSASAGTKNFGSLSEVFSYTAAGYFEENCQSQGLRWRCVWLPSQERKILLESSLFLRTLGQALAREFFCDASGHIYYARNINELHMDLQEQSEEKTDLGFKQNLKKYPYCYPLSFTPLEARGVVQRDFSPYGQYEMACLGQKSFQKEKLQAHAVRPLKALFALCEGAQLQYAWLRAVAFMHVEFFENTNDICTVGMTQESEMEYAMAPHDTDMKFVYLASEMRFRAFAPNGRRTGKWQRFMKATCLLAGAQQHMDAVLCSANGGLRCVDDASVQKKSEPNSSEACEIKQFSILYADIAQGASSWYSFVSLCVEAIFEKIFPKISEVRIRSIESICFLPSAPENCGQELLVVYDLMRQEEGNMLHVRVLQADGTVLLSARNILIMQ